MRYYLGAGAGYKGRILKHTFTHGSKRDCEALREWLAKRYAPVAQVVLCKNGRSGLALALQGLVEPGTGVIVNGFTCYAVVEAVQAVGCVPIYADIAEEDLNFDVSTLKAAIEKGSSATPVRAIIIQNTLGNPVDIEAIEEFAKKHNLVIIEDLAHCAGVKYKDGREAGTVGAATVLSFGKEKSIDCANGGAVVIRRPSETAMDDTLKGALKGLERAGWPRAVEAPVKRARVSDHLRARFYPLLAAIYRGLNYVKLGSPWMWLMLKLHFVEKSADNRLDLTRKISPFEAKLALAQLKGLRRNGARPIREFRLVENRDEVLRELSKNGYYFSGFWYERPVSPERYYEKVHFPEKECPVATGVAGKIVNFPTIYRRTELKKAYQIVEKTGKSEVEKMKRALEKLDKEEK